MRLLATRTENLSGLNLALPLPPPRGLLEALLVR
jgi:hypothetical protein